ncbi:MAG TPA: 30S ribosomal protein S9 [Candidatus Thermoplasmatota archaeon]
MAKKTVTASGKRKTAIARAVARKGEGRLRVNRTPIEIFQPEVARLKILEPIAIAEKRWLKLDVDVNVKGGGVMGQADAVRTALARVIVEFTGDDDLKEQFVYFDRTLLVNDTRLKLPKKQLGRGARKKRQKSYR